MATESGDIHRLGGGSLENLRLKPVEMNLDPPGISVLKAPSARKAVMQMWEVFPKADLLHEKARVVGTTSIERIRSVGFEVIPKPTRKLPNHYRIIHPQDVAGFNDANLMKLSEVFVNTSDHKI